MSHPNEKLLSDAYALFGKGDMPGYLAMCQDDIRFTVPGNASFSGTHTKADFGDWIGKVMTICGGKFRETVVDVIANDEHGVVVLDHWLERDGQGINYRVDHIYTFRDGKLANFVERPGSVEEFNRAWT